LLRRSNFAAVAKTTVYATQATSPNKGAVLTFETLQKPLQKQSCNNAYSE
jgi:hypothetical protein